MKLISLTLRNFRQHADTTVEFPTGLVGILGANGEGKSTLLEGIAFALFGARAMRGTKGSLRWNRAPARRIAEAVLRFEVGGVVYEVQRTEHDAKLFQVGRETPIAEKASGVDEDLPKKLGMAWEEFRATYLCAQKDLGNIAAMKGTARRTFFLNVMGVGRIVDALKQLREDKNGKRRERDGLQLGLGDRAPREAEVRQAEAALAAAQSEIQESVDLLTAAVLERDARAEALAASAAKKDAHDRLVRVLEDAERDFHRAGQDRDGVLTNLEAARRHAARAASLEGRVADLPSFRARRDELREARATAAQRQSLKARAAEIARALEITADRAADAERQIGSFSAEGLAIAEAAHAAARERHAKLVEARDRAHHAASAARDAAQAEAVRQRRRVDAIRAAGEAGDCPTCFRRLAEQFAEVLAGLEADLRAYLETAEAKHAEACRYVDPSDEELAAEAEVDALSRIVSDLHILRADAELATMNLAREREQEATLRAQAGAVQDQLAALPGIAFDAAALAEVESAIADRERLARELETARAYAARVPELEADAERYRATMVATAERGNVARAERNVLGFDAEAHRALEVDAAIAERAANEAMTRRERAEVAASGARAWVDRARATLAEYDQRAERLHALEEELRTFAAAEARLDQFREAQAASIRPEMEELTSAFVAHLTDGRFEACTLNDDFEPVLKRGGMDMEVISGGEEDVVAIAMRLAVSQMIAERAGHPLSLLILDEPFGSQDQVRQANMVGLIRRLSDTFSQVLVISHVEEIKDAVDSTITVRFDEAEGRSVVVGARTLEAVA